MPFPQASKDSIKYMLPLDIWESMDGIGDVKVTKDNMATKGNV
ncbi:hypothetical protein SAMN05421771_1860 [Granulicella pectinivorans]|uniref:Uncharacterized protein n=1 Tax=Granulicella pectinivorans TaxID=474950 RepID=A0A1I6M5B8_9BACT|nr:hypothetical protein SAMN05421771_1860 [Granulicella pectinivorans]